MIGRDFFVQGLPSSSVRKMPALSVARVIADEIAAPTAIRLLLFTGCRLSEILELRWSWVNLERKRLELPDSKTGAKLIFLNEPAIEVLRGLPRLEANPFVVAGSKAGQHLVNLQKPWRRIRKAANLPDVRIDDLRHNYASVAAGPGEGLPMTNCSAIVRLRRRTATRIWQPIP